MENREGFQVNVPINWFCLPATHWVRQDLSGGRRVVRRNVVDESAFVLGQLLPDRQFRRKQVSRLRSSAPATADEIMKRLEHRTVFGSYRPVMRSLLVTALLAVAACSVAPEEKSAQQPKPTSFKNILIIREPGWPTPDSFATGRFVIDGPCLLFETQSGLRYNPIFPSGTIFTWNEGGRLAIAVGGRAIVQGEWVTVKGGSGEYGRAGSLDETCADRNFIVGGLREQDV